MKKIAIILLILLSFFSFAAKAEVINVCGGDTVVLSVDNYINGIVEWQESLDLTNWSTISEENGTTYKFHPTESKYYRAVVKTSDCSPLYSEISYVQLIAVANAGSDRSIGNGSTLLFGNTVSGATGMWTILSGKGGVIEDPTNPNSKFSGVNQETYTLKWTLTSACGESSDSVVIDFDEVIIKQTFIVVDNTDSLYSDSTQVANGIYKIKFSDPTIVPFDSLVLVGIRDDYKFIRRVTGFTLNDSIYTFNTIQGTFEDVVASGSLNFGEAVNESMMVESDQVRKKSPSIYRSSLLPTRESLKNGSDSKGIRILYTNTVLLDDSVTNISSGISKVRSNIGPFRTPTQTTKEGFTLNIPNVTLLSSPDKSLSLKLSDTWMTIAPRFVFDFSIGFFTIKNIKIGIDDGYFQTNYKISLDAQLKKEWSKEMKLLHYSTSCCFAIGPLPVWIETEFSVVANASASVSAAVNYTHSKNYKVSMTALIEGKRIKDLHTTYIPPKVETTSEDSWNLKGELGAELKIGPEIFFKLYGIIGPYINLPATAKIGFCANNDGNWKTSADLGLEANLGAKAKLWGWTIFNYSYQLFHKSFYKVEIPYKLEMVSGNNQTAKAWQTLSNPIAVKAVSDKGFGVPLVPVRFAVESGNGTVSDQVVYTDMSGNASAKWTLGSNDTNTLKVSLHDCDNQDMQNSPMYFSANPPVGCGNNNFIINLNTKGIYTTPTASGGNVPYSYSKDGQNFSTDIPVYSASSPGYYTVYAKDAGRCVTSKSFLVEKMDPCKNCSITENVFSQANFAIATGSGGTPPYMYSIDDSTSFSSSNSFYRLKSGSHYILIKDSYGCLYSTTITTDLKDAAINAVFPKTGSSVYATSFINFQWSAGNYVNNQTYDLYLNKEGAQPELIASNLTDASFTYNKLLDKSTAYNWKIVVKNPAGIELDDFESVFTTSNGVPVSTPILLAPMNDGFMDITSTPVKLSWTSQGAGFVYDLYLDAENASKLVANNLTDAQFITTNQTGGKTYYWKVKATSTITGENLTSVVSSYKAISTPVLGTTTQATAINESGAKSGGNVLNDGGLTIINHGVCWNTNSNPTIDNARTSDGTGTGTFTSTISNLLAGTTYYVRSYATNSLGISYGSEISFTTKTSVPVLSTIAASSVTKNSVNTGGNISADGGVAVFARGVCWSTTTNPTTDLSTKTNDGSGTGLFTRTISGLTTGTTYYIRAYATNSNGTSYGNEICFTTLTLPTLSTTDVTEITGTTATGGATVSSDGGAAVTARGICWSNSQNPTINLTTKTSNGTGIGTFADSITGLTSGMKYYVRAYATNSVGTNYGNEVSFTTIALPTLTTVSISDISIATATSGGNITLDGGTPITERGICWNTSQNPTINLTTKTSNGTGTGTFADSITGLTSGMKYYVRAYATNSAGTSYGNELSFTTLAIPIITTIAVSEITGITANSGGNIIADGGATITSLGVCWSTTPNPTTDLVTKTVDSIGSGSFTSSISGLSNGTKYYLRGYAVNSVGIAYGNEVSFTTLSLPVLTTNEVTAITGTTASSGGTVTADGGTTITSRGVCWSTSKNPTVDLITKTNDGTGNGTFSSLLVGLTSGTTYYVRAYAINSVGTAYSSENTFTTFSLPTIDTRPPGNITGSSALVAGVMSNSGGSDVTSMGICWSTSPNPTVELNTKTIHTSIVRDITDTITGLSPGTTYYIRAYATNIVGTAYGTEFSFTTNTVPTVTTSECTAITSTTATGGGIIKSYGNGYLPTFGICWSTSPNPTTESSKIVCVSQTDGVYSNLLSGLTTGTTYYVRAYATNPVGTAYGNEVTFKTL